MSTTAGVLSTGGSSLIPSGQQYLLLIAKLVRTKGCSLFGLTKILSGWISPCTIPRLCNS